MKVQTEKQAQDWIKSQAVQAAVRPLNKPGRSPVRRPRLEQEPVPRPTGRAVSWNGAGGGLLRRVEELEQAVKTLAVQEPAELDKKYHDLVTLCDDLSTRLANLDHQVKGIEEVLG